MINSNHSYERLNWNEKIYKPIFSSHDSLLGDTEKVISDCDNNIGIDDCIEGRSKVICLTTPVHREIDYGKEVSPKDFDKKNIVNNRPGDVPQPYIIIRGVYTKMMNHMDIENAYFLSLNIPPDTNVVIRKKKTKYFLLPFHHQIRYLRNIIYTCLRENKITKYIIVFELTKNGIIHAHICGNFDEYHPSCFRSSYCSLLNINTIKKSEINCNIVKVTSKSIFEYLCKIEINEDFEDTKAPKQGINSRGLDAKVRKNRNKISIKKV